MHGQCRMCVEGISLREFIIASPVLAPLYSVFLEKIPNQHAERSHEAFLIWFALELDLRSKADIVLTSSVKSAISRLDHDLCHPLMYYAAAQGGISFRGEELRTWYYTHAVEKYRLVAYLSYEEISTLSSDRLSLEFSSARETGGIGRCSARCMDFQSGNKHLQLLAEKTVMGSRYPSVSIVGFHRSVLGIGEDARSLFASLCFAGIICELVDVSYEFLEEHDGNAEYSFFESVRPTGTIIIFCMPAHEMARAILKLNIRKSDMQIWVGYWPWETSDIPESWKVLHHIVDEVWASSRFLEMVYLEGLGTAVRYMPPYIRKFDTHPTDDFADLLADRFNFLNIFDFNSTTSRKNPLGLVEAFKAAFPDRAEPVQLVFKTINGQACDGQFANVLEACRQDSRIVLVDGVFTSAQLAGLMKLSDVYVSLHRSEGFGRPIAEAMLSGLPVIATDWSGSSDYVDDHCGYPINYALREVNSEEYPLACGNWAEPDLRHAAEMMRLAYLHRRDLPNCGAKSRTKIENLYGIETVSTCLKTAIIDLSLLVPHHA